MRQNPLLIRQSPQQLTMKQLRDLPEAPKKPAAGCVGSRRKKVTVDEGKLLALRKAGWSLKKIADELKISEGSVFNYLKKMEGEHGTINT